MKITGSVLLIVMLAFGCIGVPGQVNNIGSNTQISDPEVRRLLDAIQILESIDQDPTTPPTVKQRNLRALQQRRLEIQSLLKSKIYDLQQYDIKLRQKPEAFEKEIKDNGIEIAMLQKELERAQRGARQEPVSARPLQEQSNTPQEPVSARPLQEQSNTPQENDEADDSETETGEAPSAQPNAECVAVGNDPRAFPIADRYRCQLVADVMENKKFDPSRGIDPRVDAFPIALLVIAKKDRPAYLVEAEEKRVDKQIGSGPANAGSTSLTVKGSGPQILGLAVENGALTQSVNGTTVTFRGNPLGIVQALGDKGYVESFDEAQKYALTRFLRKFSFHFSFDTSRGDVDNSGQMQNIFTADRQQLSEVGVRYEIYNKRDPRSKQHQAKWERLLISDANLDLSKKSAALISGLTEIGNRGSIKIATFPAILLAPALRMTGSEIVKKGANICMILRPVNGVALAVFSVNAKGTPSSDKSTGTTCGVVSDYTAPSVTAFRFKDPALQKWYEATQQEIQAAGTDRAKVEEIIKRQTEALPVDQLSDDTLAVMRDESVGFDNYLKEKKKIVDEINQGGIVTFEYTNTRNVNSPNLSNFRLVAEKGAGGNFDATFNGSLTIFDKIPMGLTKRIRDFQFSGQLDAILGNVAGAGNLVLSFSGRYERLMENAMAMDGMTVMDTKGDIAVGQAKLTIPVKGTGFKIPISVTFANRTELIKEKEVRGNIGFTFDLDALFAKFKP